MVDFNPDMMAIYPITAPFLFDGAEQSYKKSFTYNHPPPISRVGRR